MATKVLPPIFSLVANQAITVENPWQGQGLNAWQALIRNESPYGLIIGAEVNSFWLGPYEEDYYEFSTGSSFLIIPMTIGPVPVGGVLLITAFDQSSKYDGVFPTAITQPVLQQTFTKLATGSVGASGPSALTGPTNFAFNAVYVVLEASLSGAYPTASGNPPNEFYTLNPPLSFALRAGGPVAKTGSFLKDFTLVLAVSAPGPSWDLDTISTPLEPDGSDMPYSFTYTVYAVTITDVDSLVEESQTFGVNLEVTGGGGPNPLMIFPGLEENIRTTRSKRLLIEGTYSGPATLVLNTAAGTDYDSGGQPIAINTKVILDDPTNPAGTYKAFSFARDIGTIWDLGLASSNTDSEDINLIAVISLMNP